MDSELVELIVRSWLDHIDYTITDTVDKVITQTMESKLFMGPFKMVFITQLFDLHTYLAHVFEPTLNLLNHTDDIDSIVD